MQNIQKICKKKREIDVQKYLFLLFQVKVQKQI
jgi:hypothetical protein